MELFRLFGTIALNNSEANNAIDETTGRAEGSEPKIGSAFKKIGAAVATYFAVDKIVAFGKSVVDVTASFEDGMLKVQSLTGATQEEYQKLSDAALDYGSKTAWTAKDVSDAMGYMALAGFNTNEILDSTSGMLSLASASGEDLATVTDILTDSMTGFGDSASDAGRYADVLATTQAKTNTTVGLLGEAFKYVSPLAGSYGYKLEDVSTALGLMANAGVKGSMAGTSLSSIITRLATDAGATSKSLGALGTLTEVCGVEFYNSDGTARNLSDVIVELCDATKDYTAEQKAEIATKIAGQEAQKGFLAILNQGSGAYKELQEQLESSSGAASDMATNMESGLGGSIRSLQSAWEGFRIKLGEKISPGVEEGLRGFATFITDTAIPSLDGLEETGRKVINCWNNKLKPAFENLMDAFQPAVDAVQPMIDILNDYISSGDAASDASDILKTSVDTLVSVVNTLADIVGSVTNGLESFYKWCEKNKTAAEILAIAVGTLTTAIIAYNAAQAIKQAGGLAEIIQLGILSAEIGALTIAETIATAATTAFGAVMAFVTSPITLVVLAIGALIAIGVLLYKNWDKIKEKAGQFADKIGEKWNNVKEKTVEAWNGVKEKTAEAWNNVKETMSNAMSSATSYVSGKLNKIKDAYKKNGGGLKGIVAATMESIKQYYSVGYDAINKLTGGKLDKIKNAILDKMNIVKDKVKEIIDAIKGFFHFEFDVPKIKMPHFKITPKRWKLKDLFDGSIPKLGIDWYAKGGVMTDPTVFGMNGNNAMIGGEKGPEAIAPIETLQKYIAEAVAANNEGMLTVLEKILYAILSLDENMGGNIVDALDNTSIKLNNREFGRMVRKVVTT